MAIITINIQMPFSKNQINKLGETLKYAPSALACALVIDRLLLTTSDTIPLELITPTKSAGRVPLASMKF